MALVRYEVPVLVTVAAASFLGGMLARDRLTRWANALLASTALLLAVLRLVWDMRRELVMAIEPVYQLFIYRQAALLVAAGIVFAIRLALLVIGLRRRACLGPACGLLARQMATGLPEWGASHAFGFDRFPRTSRWLAGCAARDGSINNE